MYYRKLFIFSLLLVGTGLSGYGQQRFPVEGTVFDTSHLYVIPEVDVYTTGGEHTTTDSLGVYRVAVTENDSIYFFYNGKNSMKYPVSEIRDFNSFDIALQAPVQTKYKVLKEVTVLSNSYRQDSLENRERYASIFGNRGGHLELSDGGVTGVPGLDIGSIVGLFQFRKNKQNRLFQERLVEQEQEGYVDYRFNARLITRMTGLEGVYLEAYMEKYRPSYYFTRNSSLAEFYEYILNTSYEFKDDHGMPVDRENGLNPEG